MPLNTLTKVYLYRVNNTYKCTIGTTNTVFSDKYRIVEKDKNLIKFEIILVGDDIKYNEIKAIKMVTEYFKKHFLLRLSRRKYYNKFLERIKEYYGN